MRFLVRHARGSFRLVSPNRLAAGGEALLADRNPFLAIEFACRTASGRVGWSASYLASACLGCEPATDFCRPRCVRSDVDAPCLLMSTIGRTFQNSRQKKKQRCQTSISGVGDSRRNGDPDDCLFLSWFALGVLLTRCSLWPVGWVFAPSLATAPRRA